NPDAHPVGRVDRRELDIRPAGKHRVMLDRGTHAPKTLLVWQRAEQHALWISHIEHDGGQWFAARHERHATNIARLAHPGTKRVPGVFSRNACHQLLAGFGSNRHTRLTAIVVS